MNEWLNQLTFVKLTISIFVYWNPNNEKIDATSCRRATAIVSIAKRKVYGNLNRAQRDAILDKCDKLKLME